MIYTVTSNPALDYVIKVNRFMLGTINRTVQEDTYHGDKGVGVSTVLKSLGYNDTVLGFVAGFTGDEIVGGAKTLGFIPDSIRVGYGIFRINVKVKSDEESKINGTGPEITPKGAEKLFEKLEKLVDGDILILSGSIPKSTGDDIHENIMTGLDRRGIRIIVGVEKNLLSNVLQYHPFLIEPDDHELGDMFGVVLSGDGEIMGYVKKPQERGTHNVLISMAGDGAIPADETGKTHRMEAPEGVIRNLVGAGDSIVAGFVAGYLERQDYEHAPRLGSVVGSASTSPRDLALKEDIMKSYQELSGETKKAHAYTGRPGDGQEG